MNTAALAEDLGITWFDYQQEAFTHWEGLQGPAQRVCLYYRTGAGKTITALTCLALAGWDRALVVAPLAVHRDWVKLGTRMGIEVTAISHARFRQAGYKVSLSTPLVADEFHMFGGYNKIGWRKLDRLAFAMKAPIILCSATPNYNDAERCYCVQRILHPDTTRGGYLQFLADVCTTKVNPFGVTPEVTGFQRHRNAEHYLLAMRNVLYLEDNVKAVISDLPMQSHIPDEFTTYGLNRREGNIMASQIEQRHQRQYINLLDDHEFLRTETLTVLLELLKNAPKAVMIYSRSSKVGDAVSRSLTRAGVEHVYITSKINEPSRNEMLTKFKAGTVPVLIGTDALATGTDGLDKVCDTLVIINDTDDDAQRKQLMGRILPRGLNVDASGKTIVRLVF